MNKKQLNFEGLAIAVLKECSSLKFISECNLLCEKQGKNKDLIIHSSEFWGFLNQHLKDAKNLEVTIKKSLDDLWCLHQFRVSIKKEIECLEKALSKISFFQALNPLVASLIVGNKLSVELQKKLDCHGNSRFSVSAINKVIKGRPLTAESALTEDNLYKIIELWNFYKEDFILEELEAKVLYDRHFLFMDENSNIINDVIPGEIDFIYLERFKKLFEKRINKIRNQTKVDAISHFKEIDKDYKTQNGLAFLGVFGGKVIDGPPVNFIEFPQITGLNVEGEIYNKMLSQHLNVYFRNALENFYEPISNLESDSIFLQIKKQKIDFRHTRLICAFLSAISDLQSSSLRTVWAAQNARWIKDVSENYKIHFYDLPRLLNSSLSFETCDLEQVSISISNDKIANFFHQIEELKELSSESLNEILSFIISDTNSLGIYWSLNKDLIICPYLLKYGNFIQSFYFQRVIPNLLNFKSGNEMAERNKIARDNSITIELINIFKKLELEVHSNINFRFKGDTGTDITGEMDMLVYSKSENAFLIIEIKRNDRLAYNSYSKWNWRKENASKLISQIKKDVFYLFKTNEGEKFLKDTFGEEASSASFFPLFLTDNFIMDHEKLTMEVQSIGEFIINTVSSFELCMLLGNKYSGLKVASELSNSIDFNRERPLESLIRIIDNNEFWEFVFTKLKTKPIIHLTRRTEPKFCFVE